MANDILAALMAKLGGGGTAPPPPAINEAKPWETQMAGVSPPPMQPAAPAMASNAPPQQLSDQALMEALKKLQMNQAFAAGTGNPVPR